MKLVDLISGFVNLSEEEFAAIANINVLSMALDSRKITTDGLFVAVSGAMQHGLTFAEIAVGKGAIAVIYDPQESETLLSGKEWAVPMIPVPQLGEVVGHIAARFYCDPSTKLDVIGITGTNGKTSCSQFLGQALDKCGIVGTLGWGDWGNLNSTANTTPDAMTIQQVLANFVEGGKKAAAMEVSSHGLHQGRVNGVEFKGAVYTNISRDHLDYHGTMDAYLSAKLKLVQKPGLQFVVINLDDESSAEIVAATPESVAVWGVTAKGKKIIRGENVCATDIRHTFGGMSFSVLWRSHLKEINVPLHGDFNVENILCVIGVMLALGYEMEEVAARMATIKPVTGRMEQCRINDKLNVFIDYAHTPDALDRVLGSLRKHCGQDLWVVFGCGGNRDAGKRPQMGAIAEHWADHVVITDDNPRHENPVTIAQEILAGCRSDKAIVIQDRKSAINHAITNAHEFDYIVIAGKGHENYQEINDVKYPFNDRTVAEEALVNRFGVQ